VGFYLRGFIVTTADAEDELARLTLVVLALAPDAPAWLARCPIDCLKRLVMRA